MVRQKTIVIKSQQIIQLPEIKSEFFQYALSNISDQAITFFWQGEKGPNFRSVPDILESLHLDSLTEKEKAYRLWEFVSSQGFRHEFDYECQIPDNVNPLALVNFPYFLCGEKAGILANLAEAAGLNSRNVFLQGHIVTEIFYNQKWHLFDADENVIFFTENNEIADAAYLALHIEKISDQNKKQSVPLGFRGCKKYKKYFKNFESNELWINRGLIPKKFVLKTMDITLYPSDIIQFNFKATNYFLRWKDPRHLYHADGVLKRTLNKNKINVKWLDKNTCIFYEQFPFITQSISVHLNHSSHVEMLWRAKDRVQNKIIEKKINKNKLSNNYTLQLHPYLSNEIFYDYEIVFKNTTPQEIENIQIESHFEFNTETFAPYKSKTFFFTFLNAVNDSLLFNVYY